jgi:hypothetical protein
VAQHSANERSAGPIHPIKRAIFPHFLARAAQRALPSVLSAALEAVEQVLVRLRGRDDPCPRANDLRVIRREALEQPRILRRQPRHAEMQKFVRARPVARQGASVRVAVEQDHHRGAAAAQRHAERRASSLTGHADHERARHWKMPE